MDFQRETKAGVVQNETSTSQAVKTGGFLRCEESAAKHKKHHRARGVLWFWLSLLAEFENPKERQSPPNHYPSRAVTQQAERLVSVSTCAGFIRLRRPWWEVASSNRSQQPGLPDSVAAPELPCNTSKGSQSAFMESSNEKQGKSSTAFDSASKESYMID